MSFWGIVIAATALLSGVVGIVFLFWGYNRRNRSEPATTQFSIAGACAIIFAGLLYLGGKLGLLW